MGWGEVEDLRKMRVDIKYLGLRRDPVLPFYTFQGKAEANDVVKVKVAPPPLPCGRLVVVATVVRTGGVSTLRGRFACGWVSVRLALRASLVVSFTPR